MPQLPLPAGFDLNINYWVLQTLAMLLTAFLIPNLTITNPLGALLTVVALAFINSSIWDAALFLQVPDSITMHTAMLFLSNGLIFWILVKLLPGIECKGFLPALIAPVVFTLCSLVISKYLQHIDWIELAKSAGNQIMIWKDQLQAPSPTLAPSP